MKRNQFKCLVFGGLLLMMMGFGVVASAQSKPDDTQSKASWNQNQACPGWNNPNSFVTGSSACYYQGRTGSASGKSAPNVMTANDGASWNTGTIAANQMASTVGATGNDWGNQGHKNYDKEFTIINSTDAVGSHPVNKDPNTLNNLQMVPTQFNTTNLGIYNTNFSKSIRVGNCASGSGGSTASALRYIIHVNPDNAMMYIYYAVVVQKPHNNTAQDPAFVIRVMKNNGSTSNPNWQQVSDRYAYYISSTVTANGGNVTVAPNMSTNGWHQVNVSGTYGTAGDVLFKDWAKVGINLSEFMTEDVMLEVIMMDCTYTYHFGYAYIAGECRPMRLETTGCPNGMSTEVTTLKAPTGMLGYKWYASNWGVEEMSTTDRGDGRYSYRLISPANNETMDTFNLQAAHFNITRRAVRDDFGEIIDSVRLSRDSLGMKQTVRCDMKSAIDPSKPFWSSLYVDVENTKPTAEAKHILHCDGMVDFDNESHVSGSSAMIVDSLTTWYFYDSRTDTTHLLGIAYGDTAHFQYSDSAQTGKSVVLRTFAKKDDTSTCYTDKLIPLNVLTNPVPKIVKNKKQLCPGDSVLLGDQTAGPISRRIWRFTAAYTVDEETGDTTYTDIVENEAEFTRSLTHTVEPIELEVYNGLFSLNPNNLRDTLEKCHAVGYDTVHVFVNPTLNVSGETIVCQGETTDAVVEVEGMENCRFQWSRTNGTVTPGIPEGDHLRVQPYADTSVYYVKVTSTEGCYAWDSIYVYLVSPKLNFIKDKICPGRETVLYGSAADHYTWTSSPVDTSLSRQDSLDTIRVTPWQTTTYYMVGHGANDCNADTINKVITVIPEPISRVEVYPDFVDTDDPTVTLHDRSQYGVRSSWLFNNSEVVEGTEITHTFEEAIGNEYVTVVLTSYNELGCSTIDTFTVPVKLFTAWFPNIFIPGADGDNAHFKLHSVNNFENFHIYIYNRRGELVFESEDPLFEWDGTYKGQNCPQDAYVYVCNYRKPGTPTLTTLKGTITLLR